MNNAGLDKSQDDALNGNSTEALLLQLIHAIRVTTRSELVEISHLSPSTVSTIIRRLIQNGLIEETGTGPSTGGRPPVQLNLRPQARFAIGAEFSLHKLKVVVTDLYAALIREYEIDPPARNAESITGALIQLITQALADTGRNKVVGIGIAVPGVTDPNRGLIEFYSDLNLRKYPMGSLVQEATGIYTVVNNRVMAAAMGEKWQGSGRQVQNLFYASLGEVNVGGGLVLHGEPYRGASMASAEIGHVTVMPNGPLCFCGNRGCLQVIASKHGLISRVRHELKQGHPSSLIDDVDHNLELIDESMILMAAQQGDELATRVLTEIADCVGIALGNVINLISPDLVVLGGPLIDAHHEPWLELTRSAVQRHSLAWPLRKAQVVVGQLGNDSRSIGAAALAVHSWLKSQSPLRLWDLAEISPRDAAQSHSDRDQKLPAGANSL